MLALGAAFGTELRPAAAQLPPTANIRLQNGGQPGAVIVSWDAVPQAAYYRIGYVNMARDYPVAKASATGEWLEAFRYSDVNARNFSVVNGRASYTIRGLCQNTRHAITVLTTSSVINTTERFSGEYYWPQNPRWQFITTAAHGGACIGAEPTPALSRPTSTPRPTPHPTPTGTGDYDTDKDGLIEISNLEQLDAIRWDLDGDGVSHVTRYRVAFPNAMPGMGCPAGCAGYELVADLDFDTNGNGEADAGDAYWNNGAGWAPIGEQGRWFDTTFDGSGHTIANLYVNRGNDNRVGLFRDVGWGGNIRNVGLIDVAVN